MNDSIADWFPSCFPYTHPSNFKKHPQKVGGSPAYLSAYHFGRFLSKLVQLIIPSLWYQNSVKKYLSSTFYVPPTSLGMGGYISERNELSLLSWSKPCTGGRWEISKIGQIYGAQHCGGKSARKGRGRMCVPVEKRNLNMSDQQRFP